MVKTQQSSKRTLICKVVVALATSVVVSGCATSQQQIDSHAPALNSWVGAPIEEFLDMQGPPTTVVHRVDYQIYTFDAIKTKRTVKWATSCGPTSSYGGPTSQHEPQSCQDSVEHAHATTFTCRYELLVAENVINDWRMNGNNCRMVTVIARPS